MALAAPACRGKAPKWDAPIWAGSSETEAIERRQAGQLIECKDPRFDDYMCITYEDFKRNWRKLIDSCQSWNSNAELVDVAVLWKQFKAVRADHREPGPRSSVGP